MGRLRKDLRGQRFGSLVILGRHGIRLKRNIVWLCQCDCGTKKEVLGANLYNGTTQSCGCKHSLPPCVAGYNRLFKDYKNSARKRNLSFDLSKENFLGIIQKNCH